MMKTLTFTVATFMLVISAAVTAGDWVKNERVILLPAQSDTFETGPYRFGVADLIGYLGDLKERKRIRGLLLKKGERASERQKQMLVHVGSEHHLDVSIEIDGTEQVLVSTATPQLATDVTAEARTR
jgi:hypothetical protein